MRAIHNTSEYTGSRKGNPDSRVSSSDLWRRPSTELKPVATSGGSVRNDRCNKTRSPRANAPAATRASRHRLPVAKRRERNSFPSSSQGEIQRGSRSGCLAKGRVNGRGFGRRRTLVAKGREYGTRMCKTTRWEATALNLKVATRTHGLATWVVTGSGKLSSSTPRTTRRSLMDCDPSRKVAITFNGKTTPANR